jgi:hypothetical protein
MAVAEDGAVVFHALGLGDLGRVGTHRVRPRSIVPIVLHHSESGWTAPTRFRELLDVPAALAPAFAPFLPDFGFVLDDLSKLDDGALRARALTELARLTFVAMQRCRGAADSVAILRPWNRALVPCSPLRTARVRCRR